MTLVTSVTTVHRGHHDDMSDSGVYTDTDIGAVSDKHIVDSNTMVTAVNTVTR